MQQLPSKSNRLPQASVSPTKFFHSLSTHHSNGQQVAHLDLVGELKNELLACSVCSRTLARALDELNYCYKDNNAFEPTLSGYRVQLRKLKPVGAQSGDNLLFWLTTLLSSTLSADLDQLIRQQARRERERERESVNIFSSKLPRGADSIQCEIERVLFCYFCNNSNLPTA